MIVLHIQGTVLFPRWTLAKSVQEKLVEAILTEGQCHSEPELSDTTTEEEEESTGKDNQHNKKGIVLNYIVHYNRTPNLFWIYSYVT